MQLSYNLHVRSNVRDAEEAVSAMLANGFLKEHRNVPTFHAKFAQQQKQIEALTATVQKVSDQIALSKRAPQLVANP